MQNAECGVRSVELRAAGRLVLALEIERERDALGIVDELKDRGGLVKGGHQLFTV